MVLSACSAQTGARPGEATPTSASVFSNQQGICLAPNGKDAKASGLVQKMTLAKGVNGETKEARDPTSVFGTKSEFHLVVAIQDAPAGTKFRAVWYATDISVAANCVTKLEEASLSADGTRNLDFSLAPKESWLPGSYRVDLFVNGALDQTASFQVE